MRALRFRQAVVGCIVAIAALVGCTDDDPPPAAPPSGPPGGTAAPSQVDLDRQKAQRALLTEADVPGLTQDPPGRRNDNAGLEAATNACLQNNPLLVRLGEEGDPRGARSADFSRGEGLRVRNGVTFGETEDEAGAAIGALSAPSFPGCFSDALAAELRKDATLASVTVSTSKLPEVTAGDQSVGYRSVARARVNNTAVTFVFDFTFVRSGRGVAVLSAIAVNGMFPEADRARLASTLAGRLAGP